MTRTRALLFVVIAFIATLAFGQTYVRPSKGVPVPAFAGYADAGFSLAASASPLTFTTLGTQYEWTAFEMARVRVAGRTGYGFWSQDCTQQVWQFDVGSIGTVLRFSLRRSNPWSGQSGTEWTLIASDAMSPTTSSSFGNFLQVSSPNSAVSLSPRFLGCTVDITVTPIPFGAAIRVYDADGGIINTPTGPPFQCPHIYQNSYFMDGGIIVMGAASSRGERYYTIVCNSKDNTSGNLRCRADDAGVVSTTAGSVGDVLGVGDCINYSNPVANPIHCIGGSIYATTFECSP